PERRREAFAAVENIPSIARKAAFCQRWIDTLADSGPLASLADRRRFLLNLIGFAACIEGLFFFAAFAYVYFLRARGLLPGLAAGTNWVFRDESAHMSFALDVVKQVRKEEPDLFDAGMEREIAAMIDEAVDCDLKFADDMLCLGVVGLSIVDL